MTRFAALAANYLDWEKQNHVFDRLAIYMYRSFDITGGDKLEQVDACAASSGFFATLGVQPMLGRVFFPEEEQPGRFHVVVLSHRLWQAHFGANPDIVGRNINLDGTSYLVAGVMPASLRFPDFAQVWVPMAWTDQERVCAFSKMSIAMLYSIRRVTVKAKKLMIEISFSAPACSERVRGRNGWS